MFQFEPRSVQTQDYKFSICCFSAALRNKSTDCLTWNQDNVYEWQAILAAFISPDILFRCCIQSNLVVSKLKEAVEFYFEISGWVSDENKLHFDEMMTMSALHWTNTLSWICLVAARRNNSMRPTLPAVKSRTVNSNVSVRAPVGSNPRL
jgi:hypothetical protein